MLNAHELKGRISGVEDIRQITRAMQLISASKLKKAMKQYERSLRYFRLQRAVIKDIIKHSEHIPHPYFTEREGRRAAFIVVSSDKGFAGEYNKRILELAEKKVAEYPEHFLFTIGNTAGDFFRKRGVQIDIEFLHMAQNPTLDNVRQMTYDIFDLYDQNLLDEVYLIFTSMQSSARHTGEALKLLPLDIEAFKAVEDIDEESAVRDKFEFVPSPEEVASILVPQYVLGLLYGALVQSVAAEHFERMVAMKSALDNADKMLKSLRLMAQRARQEKITTELAEISAASLSRK